VTEGLFFFEGSLVMVSIATGDATRGTLLGADRRDQLARHVKWARIAFSVFWGCAAGQ